MTNEFKGLRHYIDIVESAQTEQQVDEAGILNALGQLGGAVGGTVANGVNAVGNAVSGAYDAAKQGVSNAADAVTGAVKGAVDPLVQGAKTGYAAATGQPAPAGQTQSASPTQGAGAGRGKQGGPTAAQAAQAGQKQSASPTKGAPDPAVKARQEQLIKAGAKIKADGIAGPATAAAEQQFGGQADVMAANEKDKAAAQAGAAAGGAAQAASPTAPAAPAAAAGGAAPAASNATANTTGGPNMGQVNPANPWAPKQDTSKQDAWAKLSPEQQKWLGGADPTDPIIAARMRAAVPDKPASAQGTAAGYAPSPQQQAQNVLQPKQQATMESTGYDEIQRLVSLVHYK